MRTLTLCAALALAACNRTPDEPRTVPGPGASPPPATPQPAAPSGAANDRPARVGARHVLIMHRGSERAPANVTRTRDEARARAETVLARARQGGDIAALAREFSDEPGAATSGGDLGMFGPGQMVPAFDSAAFALGVGEVSGIVETAFGFHVIKRTQ